MAPKKASRLRRFSTIDEIARASVDALIRLQDATEQTQIAVDSSHRRVAESRALLRRVGPIAASFRSRLD